MIFPTISERWFFHRTPVVCSHSTGSPHFLLQTTCSAIPGLFARLEQSRRNEGGRGALARAAGKGDCKMGSLPRWGEREQAGRWLCPPRHGGDRADAALAASARFYSQPAKLPEFPGVLCQGFVTALYSVFSLPNVFNRAIVGVGPLSPILTPQILLHFRDHKSMHTFKEILDEHLDSHCASLVGKLKKSSYFSSLHAKQKFLSILRD